MDGPVLVGRGRLRDTLKRITLSDSWKILSSKSDDVIWNIVLAYLNSFPLSNESELTRRIKRLNGHRKVNENIRKSVQMCNPFLNRNACFNDKVMLELVSIFKDRVKDYIEEREINGTHIVYAKAFQFNANQFHFNASQFQLNAGQFPINVKNFQLNVEFLRNLEASAKLLPCTIALISFPIADEIAGDGSKVLVQFFPKQGKIYNEHIGILHESKSMSSNGYIQNDFAFCIPKEIGIQKQRQALIEILKRTTVRDEKEETIQKISHLSDVSENFIISLLKNDFGHILPFIYTSPYVLSKLTDAGFETDPRTKDSEGKSAFFHAFKTEESHLISLLYDHAANACLQTDTSVRSPDPVIVENLRCLKDYLKLMEKDLESDEISEKSRKLLRDLCRFNEFQIEMCENINSIHSEMNYYDHTEKEYEVLKKKETLLVILKTYKSYFDYAKGDSAVSLNVDGNFSRFKNFFEHRDYYDKLDFLSAMLFFNNLFLLKEKLLLPKDAYLNVESIFFLFIFFRKHFECYENEKCFHFVFWWIIYKKRLSLQKQLRNFQEILEKAKFDIINKIPNSIVTTLTNLPENYGQFLLLRLEHYSNTATSCTLKDLKSILVVERCLVVMGECCKESDFNSVQRILTLALPKDFIKYLKQIRNHFAHIKPHELLYKNNLEQDVELFIGIQNELKMLKEFLLPIYSAHKYEMDRFLLLHSEKSVHEFRRRSILEKHENHLNATLPSPEMEENQLSIPTSNYQQSWKSYFDDAKKKINELLSNGNILDTNTKSLYKFIIQNMISAVGVVLKNLKSPVSEKAVAELDSHFWCLENILSYLITDRMLASHRRTLILMLKNRKSYFTEWRKNKSTNSIIDETLVAQGERVGENLPTELEDTCDNSKQTLNPIDIFKTFGSFFDLKPCSQLVDANENENNGCFHQKPEIYEMNQVEYETNGGNFENGVSENVYDGNTIQETIDTKECKEAVGFRENTEERDPDTINLIEENDLHLSEAINTPSRDDWLLSNVYHNYPVSETGDRAETMHVKRKTFIENSATFLDDYEKFASTIFQNFPYDSNEEFHFKNIEKFCLILKGRTFLNKREKEFIVQSVPKEFRNVPELKRKVKGLLKRETNFTEEIETELFKLNLKNREIKEIKINTEMGLTEESYRIIDKARDYVLELKEKMELSEIKKGEHELLCEKLKIPDDAKDILSKIVSGQNIKVPGNQFEFLRNRIKLLKNILIDECNSIQQLWERATTPRRKMHVKEKIVQLYLNDCEIQAAVETLLFDCMAILDKFKLDYLWKKTANLLNGINLRNVLAHGHPLLESLGRLLDPCDLPSELVEKMLKLIADENVIHCIQQILELSETHHRSFMEILQDEQFKNFSEQILECDHYYEYAPLVECR